MLTFIERLEELAKYSHFLTQQFKTKINFTANQKQWHKNQTQRNEYKCIL